MELFVIVSILKQKKAKGKCNCMSSVLVTMLKHKKKVYYSHELSLEHNELQAYFSVTIG